jgi:dihydrofolate reductase
MRSVKVFESVSVNGFFSGDGGDLGWAYAHSADPEFQAFVAGNAKGGSVLLFGRVTFEMMASYWPTKEAQQQQPAVAKRMNDAEKIVLSRSLQTPGWHKTRVVHGDVKEVVGALKREAGKDIVVLGSGSVVAQLAGAGLVDEYQLVVKPVALRAGQTLFAGARDDVELRLTSSRSFNDGNLVLTYAPVR